MKRTVLVMMFFVSATFSAARAQEAPAAGDFPLIVLTANVGNSDLMNCRDYLYKLCLVKVEERIAARLAEIRPHIAALQEVWYDPRCAEMKKEKDKRKVCYKYQDKSPAEQARRLLGPDYTIVCDDRSHFECLGVRKDVGAVAGCEPGALCVGEAVIAAPAPDVCGPHAAIFAVDADIRGKKVRIVNAHPAASDSECRAAQVRDMFEGAGETPPVADPALNVIIMGDLNLNPFNEDFEDDSIAAWRAHVGQGRDFYYLSGPAEHDPPYPTCAGRAIDQVVSNFAAGTCTTLGRSADLPRLDGTSGDADPQGTDHSPILCELEFDKK